MSTNATGKRRSAEEVRQARRAVIGASVAFALVMLALVVWSIARGNYAFVGAAIAMSGGVGVALWSAYRSADEDG